jgi:hypothetical protein
MVGRQEFGKKSVVEYFKAIFGNYPESNGRYYANPRF